MLNVYDVTKEMLTCVLFVENINVIANMQAQIMILGVP